MPKMNITLAEAVLSKEAFDVDLVLQHWGWLIGNDADPILCTAFGHVFLERKDGTIAFLDTWSGDVHNVCRSYEEFKDLVGSDREFFDSLFFTDLLSSILANGTHRMSVQCFSPFVSPALGGSLLPANFSPTTLNAHLATASAEQLAIRNKEHA